MTYVIAGPCTDVLDRSCLEQCPVDCIYEGDRKLYIHPEECVDCGACEPVCPVEAISEDLRLTGADQVFVEDNRRFFTEPLPGRADALGSPGGAYAVGRVGVDTVLVAARAEGPGR